MDLTTSTTDVYIIIVFVVTIIICEWLLLLLLYLATHALEIAHWIGHRDQHRNAGVHHAFGKRVMRVMCNHPLDECQDRNRADDLIAVQLAGDEPLRACGVAGKSVEIG